MRFKGLGLTAATVMVAVLISVGVTAQQRNDANYQPAPPAIRAVLDVPPTPAVSINPTRTHLMLIHSRRYPSIEELAQPVLRLAGLRINPRTNGSHLPPRNYALTLQTIADGTQRQIRVPEDAKLSPPLWSPDGKRFAVMNTLADGIEVWLGSTADAALVRVPELRINAAYGDELQWLPGSQTLLCLAIPAQAAGRRAAAAAPAGPTIQESSGKRSPVRTYQDLLTNQHDEALFDYHATSQLVVLDVELNVRGAIGKPGIFRLAEASPNGRYLLIERLQRPYSYLHPAGAFPAEVEVWDREGAVVRKIASQPLEDQVPIEGVPTGPRSYHWHATEPSTLLWVEALDGGDPKKTVPHRDRLLRQRIPDEGAPTDLLKIVSRYAGLSYAEKGSLALLREYDSNRRWSRTFLVDLEKPELGEPLWDRSILDRYRDPGRPLTKALTTGQRVLWQDGDAIFLEGQGASPQGDQPFLDRLDLKSREARRLFRSSDDAQETVVTLLRADGSQFITRRESPTQPPNYLLRTLDGGEAKRLTAFTDPAPQLRGIKKQLVTYKRDDGVQLSMTLYLPADHQPGQRLPAILWAYPREYTDPDTAGQVSGSANRFTTIGGISHLFFLLQGYAVLDGATMPVVGDPETVNNTFIEQVVKSAKAAIDKADEMGVIDPKRVGVGGHSYGAFMTANLLAHCDLFKAGIARSGAYNRTLTPFGFQSERRTLWKAPETYIKVSPFMVAQKINEPLLLIHGAADNNAGTFPIQSERLYHAVKGNGGIVRYVSLPHESHGYAARESIEHTLHEMVSWFDKHVKNGASSELRP